MARAVVAVEAPREGASDFLADGVEDADPVQPREVLVARAGTEDGAVIGFNADRCLRARRAHGPSRESACGDARPIVGIVGFRSTEAEGMIGGTADASVGRVARAGGTVSSAKEFGCARRTARRRRQSASVVRLFVRIAADVTGAGGPERRAHLGRDTNERRGRALEAGVAVGAGRAADVCFRIVTPADARGRGRAGQRGQRRATIGRAFRRIERRAARATKTDARSHAGVVGRSIGRAASGVRSDVNRAPAARHERAERECDARERSHVPSWHVPPPGRIAADARQRSRGRQAPH